MGRAQLLGGGVELFLAQRRQPADLGADRAHVPGRLDHVAGAGLALGADHRRALADAAQRLTEVGRAADEGHGERPLVDVVSLVGGGEDLGLVDVVDAERLQHLSLDEVTDARLGHDRDRDGGDDAVDHVGVAHARHAALGPDVGRDPLERHDGDGAGVLGDLGLVGVDDVHDDAALEHLGHAALDASGAGHGRLLGRGRRCGDLGAGHAEPLSHKWANGTASRPTHLHGRPAGDSHVLWTPTHHFCGVSGDRESTSRALSRRDQLAVTGRPLGSRAIQTWPGAKTAGLPSAKVYLRRLRGLAAAPLALELLAVAEEHRLAAADRLRERRVGVVDVEVRRREQLGVLHDQGAWPRAGRPLSPCPWRRPSTAGSASGSPTTARRPGPTGRRSRRSWRACHRRGRVAERVADGLRLSRPCRPACAGSRSRRSRRRASAGSAGACTRAVWRRRTPA